MLHLFLLAYACQDDPADRSTGALSLQEEPLHAGPLDAAAPAGLSELVLLDADGLWSWSPDGALETLPLELEELSAAVRLPEDGLLLAGDDSLYSLGDLPQSAPLGEALGEAPAALQWVDEALFVGLTEKVLRWRDGSLLWPSVDGVALSPPYAVGGRLDGRAVVWATTDDLLVALSFGGEPEVRAQLPELAADALAVGPDGSLWVASEGALVVVGPRGVLHSPPVEGEVQAVYGHAGAPGVWVVTDAGVWLGTPEVLYTLEPTPALPVTPQVDAAGRLLLLHEGALTRLSTPLHLGVYGLTPGETLTEARALLPDGAPAATLWVDGELHAEDLQDGALLLDPSRLTPEAHVAQLRAEVDGFEVWSPPLPFIADGLGTVTWDQHVGPLYAERCARCHDDETETVLATPADWEARLDAVLVEVGAGRMPIGDDPLTEGEIALIELWAEGGFQ